MYPPKILTGAVLVLMVIQGTGCASFFPVERELPSNPQVAPEKPAIKVTTRDGEDVELTYASRNTMAIHGASKESGGRERITIPLEDVVRVEEKRFDHKKTWLRTGIAVAVLGLTAHFMSKANPIRFGG